MADDAKTNLTGGQGGAGDGSGSPPPKGNAFKNLSFVVEFATAGNMNTSCPITKRQYRGRMVWSNIRRREPDERFADCPDLPGIAIQYDGAARTVTIRDPLSLKSMEKVLKEAQKAVTAMGWAKPEPERPRQFRNVGDDLMKQFVYWCRRWLDNGQVVVRGGVIPSMADIDKLPGRVEREKWNTSVKRERFQKDPKVFGDREVPAYMTPDEARAAVQGEGVVNTDDFELAPAGGAKDEDEAFE